MTGMSRAPAGWERLEAELSGTADVPEPLAGRIRSVQMSAVRRLTPLAMAANLANSLLLVHGFAASAHTAFLLFWLAASTLYSLMGLRGWLRSRCRAPHPHCPPEIMRRAAWRAGLLGVLWGVVPLVLFRTADPGQQVLVTCLVSGMLSGGAFALSPMPLAAFAFVGVMIPAALVTLLTAGGGTAAAASILVVIFGAFLISGIRWNSRLLMQHFLDRNEIERLAHSDGLTGLPNRMALRSSLAAACGRARSSRAEAALLFADLDRFKQLNDTRGHHAGDLALVTVAAALQDAVGQRGMVARVGGDEFVVLIEGVDGRDAAADMAGRIIAALGAAPGAEGEGLGATIGIAMAPADGIEPDDLLSNADLALYHAKTSARGTFKFFEPAMRSGVEARRILEHEIAGAAAHGQLCLDFQPAFSLPGRRIVGCEALVRWRHPRLGLLQPADFIPLAEDAGHIREIGAWVLDAALSHARSWPPALYVAVNISPLELRDPTLATDVARALHRHAMAPSRLIVEITESVFIEDADVVLATLGRLRDLGVRLSLDDFGTGYSSLGYLRRFRFDRLKIDRIFVSGMLTEPEAGDIVRAIMGLARAFGMITTAEGVERHEEMDRLAAEGCDEVQGFLLCRPVAAEDIHDTLTKEVKLTD